jgi:hypothetical protein
MLPALRVSGLAFTLALVFSLGAVLPISAQSSAAYVYVQSTGPAGPVYGYSASSGGQLTAISGSPFKPGTAIIGSNKTEFFTIGKTLLHSYAVGSNGAIGAQKSQIGFLNYSGNLCGGGTTGISDAVLDHSGQYLYVRLQNGSTGSCSAYQTFKANSDGSFTFEGDSQVNTDLGGGTGVPSILGNETYAYADEYSGHNNLIIGFQRQSTGTLQYLAPLNAAFSGSENYTPYHPDASPTGNYVVLQEYLNNSGFPQLASFAVGPNAALTSANTPSNMPQSALNAGDSSFSPNGTLFALAGTGPNPGSGLEIYNFNGASPLTLYKKLLTGTPINQVAWDSSDHLYATSRATNKLYVFTITSTSVTQNASYSIASPIRLVVVSQSASSCSIPSGNGIHVCSPAENATVSSPVQVNAMATMSGGVYRFELWSGSTKLVSVDNSGVMNQSVPLASGTYHLVFDARNTAGTKVTATRDITVK